MQSLFKICLLGIATSTFSCQSTKTEVTLPKPKALFIIVDGIPADVIEKLELPALKEIQQAGGYTRAYTGGEAEGYSKTPTISAVGYNSLITGTWANKHNVWDNDIAAPNYNYWNIFRVAEASDTTLTTAIFSTWLDNRTKLIGEAMTWAICMVIVRSTMRLLKRPMRKSEKYGGPLKTGKRILRKTG